MGLHHRAILATVMTLSFAATGLADPYENALAAYQARDFATAARLMHEEAGNANANAQRALGFMFHDGEGVPQDYVRSYMWFYLAATLYPGDSQDFKDTMEARDTAADSMTPAQIETAQAMARLCQAAHYKQCD